MTAPATDEWTSDLLAQWLAGLVDVPVEAGPDVPDRPDRLIVATLTAGAGEFAEGVGDAPGFQLRARGGQNNRGDAEAIALAADKAVRLAAFPVWVGNVRLLSVQRLGSRPAPLSDTPDRGRRFEYTATYITRIL